MTNKTNRWVALAALGAMSATALVAPTPVQAGSKGRKNTTMALGAVTAYGLLKHKPKVAMAGAAGTAVAYHNYRQKKHSENARATYLQSRAYSRSRSRYAASHYRSSRRRHSRYRTR